MKGLAEPRVRKAELVLLNPVLVGKLLKQRNKGTNEYLLTTYDNFATLKSLHFLTTQ